MKTIRYLLLGLSLLAVSGCGSFLAAVDAEPIKDDPGERTVGAKIEDESIETKGIVNINASDEGFKSAHFSVTSYNGYVLIAGQVPTEALRQKASDVMREVRSVRRIYNELQVAGNTSPMTRSSDAWITAKIKSGMLASSDIEGTRVKVVTENGVVYLMGLLSRAEAERVAEHSRSVSGVQKVVQLFEYID
jgi:osmotically-inducible protein OsmY